ncbi:uncharacterized protein LOC130670001 [Microplitis mediator]|uniref:uncharacterized protein LOC130670001 n=1 Tax=Microplitis mediator TaxID=375433 RepID=UPI0025560B17|nr:uncharacterized protein LOC130670001 [Microplitis mediator]
MFGTWMISLVVCVMVAESFDLGPMIRIARCRIQCIKKHSFDGTCNWYSNRSETTCNECWQNCESLETQLEATKSICERDDYPCCPACQTACQYHKTRTEEEYLPSSLPAPSRGPLKVDNHDIAILMRKVGKPAVNGGWKESGFFSGNRAPLLRQDTWIIIVSADGVRHYSWEEWTPTLEWMAILDDNPFVDATLTWYDVEEQLAKHRDLERKKFNDYVREFYLEKYGERVLVELSQDTPITEDVFRRFFFKKRTDEIIQPSDKSDEPRLNQPANNNDDDRIFEKSLNKKETFVVSWEPETGGPMGNQVVDTKSAEISLLPDTKYFVRIASNDGPGSFPIEIDTRPLTIEEERMKAERNTNTDWYFYLFIALLLSAIMISIICKVLGCCEAKKISDDQVSDVTTITVVTRLEDM